MYQAVFIDIDKTLLNNSGKITENTISAIEKAKEKGIKIIIISGRSRMSAIQFKEFSSGYMVNCNGAEIYDCQKNEVLFQSVIENKYCKKLYEIAENEDFVIKLDFGFSRAVNNSEYMEDYEIHLTESIEEFLNKNNVLQIAMCHENLEKIENLKKYIHTNTELSITNQFIWEVNSKIMHSIHITNKGVSKGNAMSGLCKFLKIDLKNVTAIGDKTNDISMIEMAGVGVAMGNAIEEVKQIADFITTSNEEDGVAKVLEKILEENKNG